MKNRIGEINYNKFGSKMIITEYRKYNDITVYFEEYNSYVITRYEHFKNGCTKCPFEPRIYNVAYIGEGEYTSRNNGIKTNEYVIWMNMLHRCYSQSIKEKRPTYNEVKVCDEWLNFQNFAKWYKENHYEVNGERMHLDKDILVKGNKIYSPETCIFVPQRINTLFLTQQNHRGELPIGVYYDDKINKYKVTLQKHAERTYLGYYDTYKEAFHIYKNAKESYIKEVADADTKIIKEKYNSFIINWLMSLGKVLSKLKHI